MRGVGPDPQAWREVEQRGLDDIAATGVDLSLPRLVEHSLSFARQADAEAVAELAKEQGYRTAIEGVPNGGWVLTLTHVALLTVDYLAEMERTWRGVVASIDNAQYRGWGIEAGYLDPPGWVDPRSS